VIESDLIRKIEEIGRRHAEAARAEAAPYVRMLEEHRAATAIKVSDFRHLVQGEDWTPALYAAVDHAAAVGGANVVLDCIPVDIINFKTTILGSDGQLPS
jgi:hypothetical protein